MRPLHGWVHLPLDRDDAEDKAAPEDALGDFHDELVSADDPQLDVLIRWTGKFVYDEQGCLFTYVKVLLLSMRTSPHLVRLHSIVYDTARGRKTVGPL